MPTHLQLYGEQNLAMARKQGIPIIEVSETGGRKTKQIEAWAEAQGLDKNKQHKVFAAYPDGFPCALDGGGWWVLWYHHGHWTASEPTFGLGRE
jgi:hypothetical protein